jgi:hypothetical protein
LTQPAVVIEGVGVVSRSCCQLGPGLAGGNRVVDADGEHRQSLEQQSGWVGVAHERTVTPQRGQPSLDPALVECRVLIQPGSRHLKWCFTPLPSSLTLCWAVDQRTTPDAFDCLGEAFVRPGDKAFLKQREVDSAGVWGENLAQQTPRRVTLAPIQLVEHDRASRL